VTYVTGPGRQLRATPCQASGNPKCITPPCSFWPLRGPSSVHTRPLGPPRGRITTLACHVGPRGLAPCRSALAGAPPRCIDTATVGLKKCSSRHFGSHFGSHRKRRCRGPRVQGLLCPLNPRREHAQSTRRPRDEPCMPHLSVTKPASPPWVSMSAHTTSSGICDVVARPHQAVVASRSWP